MLVRCLDASPAPAAETPTEYDVKAAFLYNFAKFIEWPGGAFDGSNGAIVLGVLGPDPVGSTLERIAREQQVQGRPIVVKRARSLSDLGVCHVLFVAPAAGNGNPMMLIPEASVPSRLVVGDGIAFAERGGAIGFYVQERKVRFIVNTAATDRAGLKVSSKLLKIARVIRR
jgi:hypothetical protein